MTRTAHQTWRIDVDTGGTFTDALALSPDGSTRRAKVLSTGAVRGRVLGRPAPITLRVEHPWTDTLTDLRGFTLRFTGDHTPYSVRATQPAGSTITLDSAPPSAISAGDTFELLTGEEPPVVAARLLTGTPADADLPPIDLRLATTRATNALLTRSFAPTALFITRGFADLLAIGDQRRPELFSLTATRPAPIPAHTFEVSARVSARGETLTPLDTERLAQDAERALELGCASAAVVLLHADRYPEHEQAAAEVLSRAGFACVSSSSAVSPTLGLLARAQTTVVNAALEPIIAGYVRGIRSRLHPASRVSLLTSAGGLVSAGSFAPKDALLSGPAGGVVGAADAGTRIGRTRVIGFDMGGTSTDVSRYHDRHEYTFEHRVADATLRAPALAIETVAAGGGSVCHLSPTGLAVGPRSAGADPGPACYARGGPLTLTDVNLLLGRLPTARFQIPLDRDAADRALGGLLERLRARDGRAHDPGDVLEALVNIAAENTAGAVRRISTQRGYDPGAYTLVAFGGAGPMHACALADRLDIDRILVPRDAGLLSAVGLGCAVHERFAEEQVLEPLDAVGERLPAILEELGARAHGLLADDGHDPERIGTRRRIASLRVTGHNTPLEVDFSPGDDLAELFGEAYLRTFAHRVDPARTVELVHLRVVASAERVSDRHGTTGTSAAGGVREQRQRARFGGREYDVPVIDRGALAPGRVVEGPAMVIEHHASCVVEPGWTARADDSGALLLERAKTDSSARVAGRSERVSTGSAELTSARLHSIATQMGSALQRTSVSVNVKERLDFSCAVLSADAELLAAAPHVPVHLGSLSACLRGVLGRVEMRPGDHVITNHPGFGGSHLPDVTLLSPVHDDGGALLAFVASRAHHAEIGGTVPGSLPAGASNLAEEGVAIAPMHLIRGGESRFGALEDLLRGALHPSRAVEDNLADVRAAVAAATVGSDAIRGLHAEIGPERWAQDLGAILLRACAETERALEALADFDRTEDEIMDDGARVRARLTKTGPRLAIDFAGTSGVHPSSFNATPAIVRSVVAYVLRLLVDQPVGLNDGLLRPVTVTIPARSMLDPVFDGDADPSDLPAVGAGNVETSQRVANLLVRALGLAGDSQGTMNNLVFGDDTVSFYETIAGGCGASAKGAGPSATHSHMTNTAITDAEILETRYPVRVDHFAVRTGSGGAGANAGGDGLVRELTFLSPVSVSLLTQHRSAPPAGLAGGGPGLPGVQTLCCADGSEVVLGHAEHREVGAGDRLRIETPGGGGWGGWGGWGVQPEG